MSKRRQKGSLGKEIKKNSAYYFMLAPFMLLFIVFMLIPVLSSIVLGFTDFNMVQVPNFVGFRNYVRLLTNDDVFIIALKNTLILAFVTGPIGYILSFLVAWMINETGRAMRSVLTFIVYSPVLAGNVYFIWTYIFSGDKRGLFNSLLIRLGIIRSPIYWLSDTKYNFLCVIIVVIWMSFGAGFLSFMAGLQALDRSFFEAAAIDGMNNRWQELIYVTLPQMGPQLLFGAVMTISGSFAIGAQCQALTGFPSTDYSTHTILLHIIDFGSIRFEMGYASATACVLFLLMLLAWAITNKVLKKYV